MTVPTRLSSLLLLPFLVVACGGDVPAADAPAAEAPPAPTSRPLAETTAQADLGDGPARMIVFKAPTCGCCDGWIEHLEGHDFEIEPRDTDQLAVVKTDVGVPPTLQSCHTGVIDGYVIEGHVPAQAVSRLLAERPEGVAGLAVPGMPIGSPGMEGPNPEPYMVYAFDRAGNATPYMEIDPR